MAEFLIFLVVGLLAQTVDGALGMAYGVISTTMLLTFGVTPAYASAAVHGAEMFTTAASGGAHLHRHNIDWRLFARLAPFGILGGCLGAYVLTSVDASSARPFVAAYLALIGVYLIVRSWRRIPAAPLRGRVIAPLGFMGGFLDAAGGGGWGPIVTSGLLGAGGSARYVIGTVNAAEFLVTLSVSATFLIALVTGHWSEGDAFAGHLPAVAGLIVGGLGAAPLAGWLVSSVAEHRLLLATGALMIAVSAYQTARFVDLI